MQHTENPMTGIRCGPCGQEERLIVRGALHPPQKRLTIVTKSTAPVDPEPLCCAFGFTGAEAELALALAGGECLIGNLATPPLARACGARPAAPVLAQGRHGPPNQADAPPCPLATRHPNHPKPGNPP